MDTMIHTSTRVTVLLEPIEQYLADNDKGFPFTVREISTTVYRDESLEDATFTLRGFSINKDGQEGYINRYSTSSFGDLPTQVRQTLFAEVRASRLAHGVVQVVRS